MDKSVSATPPRRHLPGEAGIWVLIGGDLLMFGVFFLTFIYYRSLDPAAYDGSQRLLDEALGLTNTLILLTSSWFVAMAARIVRGPAPRRAVPLIGVAMGLGLAFLIVKGFEYHDKLAHGVTVLTSEFMMFYFMFTGIHAVHVVIGLGVLAYLASVARRPVVEAAGLRAFEGGAAFWHLVDLLWVVLFALLYLLR